MGCWRRPALVGLRPVPLEGLDELLELIEADGQADAVDVDSLIAELAAGHAKQAAALRDLLRNPNRWHSWFTSRRSGKTTAAAFALVLYALASPRRNCIYIGLTKMHAWDVILREIVVPLLDRRGIAYTLNKSRQQVTFPNGSVCSFGGSDDMRHVQTILGNRLSLAVIDEQQSQTPKVLRELVLRILPPALSDSGDGRLLLCGTWPDIEAGFALEQFRSGRYVAHSWAMEDNPHLRDPVAEQDAYLAATGRTRDDPEYLRDWKGLPVWSNIATAYRYSDKNAWKGSPLPQAEGKEFKPGKLIAVVPPPGVDVFSIGIDPASSSDRYAAVLWGWSSANPVGIWQCAEWVTDKAAYTVKSQWLAALKFLVTHYKTVIGISSDSQSTADDVALYEFSLVIEPAKKGQGSVKQRVDRAADLLGTGRMHVIEGSQLEHDLKLAKFDAEARAEGRYEWDNTVIHPDVADAGTYPLPLYIEAVAQAPKINRPLIDENRWRESWKPPTPEYGYDSHEDGSRYGGPT